jgi:hypothetical protein
MKEFINNLYIEMEEDLSVIADIGTTPINRLSLSLNGVSNILNKLKTYIDDHPFETEAEEIEFFKVHKPRFYCRKIFLVEQFSIQSNLPKGSIRMQRKYYLNELAIAERTHNQHRSVYQYYIDHENYRDSEYFLRAHYVSYLPGQDYNQIFDGFSTNQDHLFSRFRAYQLLQDWIINKVSHLENSTTEELAGKVLSHHKRRWTGDKINLIEIAYGIYYTGQMNDGKADIKEIITWLETSLSIDLSQAYRMFVDIRRRKTISYTKFLEQMSQTVQQHIEASLIYKRKNKK